MTKKKQNKPQDPNAKNLKKDFRCSEKVWNRIGILAKEYAGGNRSAWINYAAINAPRKYLVPRAR